MKIVVIGAGSYVFTPSLLKDLLITGKLGNFDIVMVDLNLESAQRMARVAEAVAAENNLVIKASATDKLDDALDGASYVIASVAIQGAKRWLIDYEICRNENIPDLLRENGCLGGLTYGIRSVSLIMSIARSMEKYCRDAVLLNVSNPLTKLQTALHRYSGIKSYGFCNVALCGANGYERIAGLLKCPHEDIDVVSAGINHFAYVISVKNKKTGEDLFPELADAFKNDDTHESKIIYEWYEKFDALAATPSGHHGEFFPTQKNMIYHDAPPFHGSSNERAEREAELNAIADGEISYKNTGILKHTSWEHPGLVIAAMETSGEYINPTLNFPNDGNIPELPAGNIIEAPLIVSLRTKPATSVLVSRQDSTCELICGGNTKAFWPKLKLVRLLRISGARREVSPCRHSARIALRATSASLIS